MIRRLGLLLADLPDDKKHGSKYQSHRRRCAKIFGAVVNMRTTRPKNDTCTYEAAERKVLHPVNAEIRAWERTCRKATGEENRKVVN